jgi:site-specific DNA-methyltransferase (adenine-specific)
MKVTDKITITQEDNMLLMARYPDNYFDLAIVDPPYGVEEITGKEFSHGRGKLKNRQFNKGSEKINIWDKSPNKEYFEELFRVSKNQIIWGGNYFDLPKYRCPIAWDKCQPWENFSQIELAWTSFNMPASIFKFDNRTGGKIHPTQKPAALYKWLLDKYAKEGDKILDTHLGSGSIAIACHDYGFELKACELDKEYYDKAIQRIVNHTNQTKLF